MPRTQEAAPASCAPEENVPVIEAFWRSSDALTLAAII
jgi:hypothetical protein